MGNVARQLQEDRIRKAMTELNPSFEFEPYRNLVDPNSPDIRFRIRNTQTGRIVAAISADYEWATTEVEDLNDVDLRGKIVALMGGKK